MGTKHTSGWLRDGLTIYAIDSGRRRCNRFSATVSADGSDATKEELLEVAKKMAAANEMLEALILAQRWLANCAPVVELDLPKPLPVIAAALEKATGTPTP